MMQEKTPQEVARGMENYDIRRGNNPLPRYTTPLGRDPIHCFDKGHHRMLSRNDLAPAGNFTVIAGVRIELAPNVGVIGSRLPVGFVAVPERYILQHFSTRYGRNIRKTQDAIVRHHKNMNVYGQQIFNGVRNFGRPRRPSLKSLNLDIPTEFERFLHPLKSFEALRLRLAFKRLVRDAEDGQSTVFDNMDLLHLPDIDAAGNVFDQAANTRWQAAANRYIAVRIDNFDLFIGPAGGAVQPPPGPAIPRIPVPPAPPARGPTAPPAPPTPMEIDEKTLELIQMGRSTKWNGTFLYMQPWQDATLVANPFVSIQYKFAFAVAQRGFSDRYASFKQSMEMKRARHTQQWREYTAYRNEMRSAFMLDTNRQPANQDFAGVERPQIERFTQEWREFTFMLKEEMKRFRFLPVDNVRGPVAPGQAGFSFTNGPIKQPYADISQSVLQVAHRMFLI